MADSTALAGYVGTWKLDPATTTVELHTKAMWVLPVKGSFEVLEGSWVTDASGATTGTLVIDAASVNTGMSKRDAHLKTADFFDVAKYPTFVYAATGVAPAADGKFLVSGTMTIHGQTLPLDVLATVTRAGNSATVVGEVADLDRSKWGLTWHKMGANLHNKLTVTAVFTRA